MISDEAVEAAAKALKPSAWDERVNWGSEDTRRIYQDDYRSMAHTALTAAAPHIAAPVWQDGYDRGLYYDVDDELQAPNPYRSQA